MKSVTLAITSLLFTVMLASMAFAASASIGLTVEKAPAQSSILPHTVNELSSSNGLNNGNNGGTIDIAISSVAVPLDPVAGEEVTIFYTISNFGTMEARASYGHQIQGRIGFVDCCVDLGPGEGAEKELSFTPEVEGDYQIRIFAYPSDPDVEDVNLDNNEHIFTLHVGKAEEELVSKDDDPILGSEEARVSIIEFADFQGPFGKRFHDDTLPLLKENFIETNDVNYVFRDFPLAIHPYAQLASEASECADNQGNKEYWKYHEYLFDKQSDWSDAVSEEEAIHFFKKYAEILDLDIEDFDYCMDNRKTKKEVEKDYQDGLDAGVRSTPTFFLQNNCNGAQEMITGAQPYSTFKSEILSLLEQPCSESTDIEVSDLVMYPSEPKVGELVDVKYVITNNGDVKVDVKTSYGVRGPHQGFGSGGCCITLGPGELYIEHFTFTPIESGEHILSVGAFPKDMVDTNPKNNEASLKFNVTKSTQLLYLGDFDKNQVIDMADLLKLLRSWGTDDPVADIDGSGKVDKRDRDLLLANWGEGRMLQADIIHDERGQCRVGNSELAAVRAHIGMPMDTTLSRLSDIDNNGIVDIKDELIFRQQRDATQHGETFDRADLNCDHQLDKKDVNLLVNLWGKQGYSLSTADLNQDKIVNSADLTIMLAKLG